MGKNTKTAAQANAEKATNAFEKAERAARAAADAAAKAAAAYSEKQANAAKLAAAAKKAAADAKQAAEKAAAEKDAAEKANAEKDAAKLATAAKQAEKDASAAKLAADNSKAKADIAAESAAVACLRAATLQDNLTLAARHAAAALKLEQEKQATDAAKKAAKDAGKKALAEKYAGKPESLLQARIVRKASDKASAYWFDTLVDYVDYTEHDASKQVKQAQVIISAFTREILDAGAKDAPKYTKARKAAANAAAAAATVANATVDAAVKACAADIDELFALVNCGNTLARKDYRAILQSAFSLEKDASENAKVSAIFTAVEIIAARKLRGTPLTPARQQDAEKAAEKAAAKAAEKDAEKAAEKDAEKAAEKDAEKAVKA